MKKFKINHLACWTAILIVCGFLYVWYNFIFFDTWLQSNNMNAEDFVVNRNFVPYAVSLLSTTLIVYVLAWVFSSLKVDDFQSGMGIALAIGFAFTFLNVLGRDLYLNRPYFISFIDGGASLISCIIAGGILGGWLAYESDGDD